MFKTQNGTRAFHCEIVQRNGDNTPGFYVDLRETGCSVKENEASTAAIKSTKGSTYRLSNDVTSTRRDTTTESQV